MDSDDVLAPTALEEAIAILNAHAEVGMVYTDYEVIDEAGNSHGLGKKCQIPYSRERLLVDFMTFHFRLMRRSVYEQVGGIDPSYEMSEDYDLCLKLSEVTDIYHLKRPLYYHRRHTGNITNNQVAGIEWASRAIGQALQRRGLDKDYDLDVKVVGHFSLHRKAASVEASPPIPATPPLVSILIPCYNAAPRLKACLGSCFSQRYPQLEIIVVDNNSTDNSLQLLQQLAQASPHPMQVLRCEVQGANHARNAAFLAARGDYIQWLDADDELGPDKIAMQVAALEAQPECSIAYCDWLWQFHHEQRPAQFLFRERPYDDMLLQLLLDNWRPPHAYLLKRAAAQQLHQMRAWHPRTTVCMDREYFTIAALLGNQFLYVPGPWVEYHHWSRSQLTRSVQYSERAASLRAIYDRLQDIAQLRSPASLRRTHWFLLLQDWQLWQPVHAVRRSEAGYQLHHQQTGVVQPVAPHQARMAAAVLANPKLRTLEDQARHAIKDLWVELLQERQTKTSTTEINFAALGQELARRVGLPVNAATIDTIDAAIVPSLPQGCQGQPGSLDGFDPFLLDLPLFSPLFGEQRLAVHGFCEHLRQQGWLVQATSAVQAETVLC